MRNTTRIVPFLFSLRHAALYANWLLNAPTVLIFHPFFIHYSLFTIPCTVRLVY